MQSKDVEAETENRRRKFPRLYGFVANVQQSFCFKQTAHTRAHTHIVSPRIYNNNNRISGDSIKKLV